MYFPSDGHRLSLQNFIHNNMNFPPYKNYKEIPLPSSDYKNYVYDYSSNVNHTPALRWSSSLVLGHPPPPSNDPNFGQLGISMDPKDSPSSIIDSNFAFNKQLSSSYPSSSRQQQQQQHNSDMDRHIGSNPELNLKGNGIAEEEPDMNGSNPNPGIKGTGKRRGRPRGPRPVENLNRVKTHGCSTCNKFFFTRQNLQQHERIHTGDFCYSCNQCDKRFIQLTHLRQHMNSVHAKARPYECQICQKSCFQPSHMQQEQGQGGQNGKSKKQNGEKVHHHCPVCQRKFLQQARLAKHITQSHPPQIS